MSERRKQYRKHFEKLPTLTYQEKNCLLVDVSKDGLGITYISDEEWPEDITLEYSVPEEQGQKWLLPCRTIWKSNSDFYRVASKSVIHRRGLEFIDPDSEEVEKIFRHLEGRKNYSA